MLLLISQAEELHDQVAKVIDSMTFCDNLIIYFYATDLGRPLSGFNSAKSD